MKEEWQKVKLENICKSISDGDHLPPPKSETGIPFVTIANIKDNKFDFSNTMFVPQSYYDKLDTKRKASNGDILYSVVGSYGIPVLIKENEPFVFQRHIAILRPDSEKIIPEYLYYTMLSKDFYAKADAVAVGAAQKTISLTSLRGIEIEVPDLQKQQKISSILSAYDDLIENNNMQIKLLEEAAQKLYKEWFVKLNFPGHENTKIVDGVPEGWCLKSILSCNFFKQTNPSVQEFDGVKKYYATADINGTNIESDGENITYNNRPSRASVQPCKNSVWFARMSNSYKILTCFGASSSLAENSIISSGFAGFTCEEKYYGFIHTLISSDFFNGEKNRYATGATQVSLTNEGLRRINILLPTEELIIQFSKQVNNFIKECELLKVQNKDLQASRDKLLPKLMNQEIEVTG